MVYKNIFNKKTGVEWLQYGMLTVFTLFAVYFCASMYHMYHMKSIDLNSITGKVHAISYHKSKGKQARPEVLIDLGAAEKLKVTYGDNAMLLQMAQEIKENDVITVYLKKAQGTFIALGSSNDILQIAKDGKVLYSLDVPQKSFHDYYIISVVMTVLLPMACIFYWIKSKRNLLEAAMASASMPQSRLSA